MVDSFANSGWLLVFFRGVSYKYLNWWWFETLVLFIFRWFNHDLVLQFEWSTMHSFTARRFYAQQFSVGNNHDQIKKFLPSSNKQGD